MVFACTLAYILRPIPKDLESEGKVFRDPKTGTVFETQEGIQPERDRFGALAFRPVSYTPWPVPQDAEGERLRVAVGPVGRTELTTFVFDRVLSGPSYLVQVTLPRPLGVVFEYEEDAKRVVVTNLVGGGNAERRARVCSMDPTLASSCIQPGDVLRATTCTNFVYPTRSLFGITPPERHIVLYGADRQGWSRVRTALRRGEVKDGEVTLVLERPLAQGKGELPPPSQGRL